MWLTRDCFKNDLNWLIYELSVHYWLPLRIQWLEKYLMDPVMIISHLGWCKTFNIVNNTEMFHESSTADYLDYKIDSKNLTEFPQTTTKKEAGFHGSITLPDDLIFCHFHTQCNGASMDKTVIIHSPFEMPTIRHKANNMQMEDLAKLAIVPRIRITDETLLHLDVDEYGTSSIYKLKIY